VPSVLREASQQGESKRGGTLPRRSGTEVPRLLNDAMITKVPTHLPVVMDVDESPNAQGVGGHDAGATASPPSAVVPGAAAPAAPAPAPAPVQEKKTPKKKTSELELLLGSAALAASAAIPVILPSAADTLDDLQGMFSKRASRVG